MNTFVHKIPLLQLRVKVNCIYYSNIYYDNKFTLYYANVNTDCSGKIVQVT